MTLIIMVPVRVVNSARLELLLRPTVVLVVCWLVAWLYLVLRDRLGLRCLCSAFGGR